MAYPKIFLKQSDYALVTQNKTGDLAMVYKPLQNLVKNTALGAFTTENLKFDRYNAQDMLILDEFDGSTNILINDDHNLPRLVNSGFAVLEDNTFLIPEHYTNSVSNIYEDNTLDLDTLLFKLYDTIPIVKFLGLEKGNLLCGSYVFYFRLADSVGNTSNIIAHSSIVQIFVGDNGSYLIRMGMQDENASKGVRFKLENLSSGFDYIRVFFERTSSSQDMATTTLFYMVDQNFPVTNNECEVFITGNELILSILLSDLRNEYADIASCKTHACVDNTLFLANTSGFVHDYKALLKIAWCIFPELEETTMPLPDVSGEVGEGQKAKGYYDPLNVYNKVGYWPDEYYRFGIVFIYNNNQLSPAFNILGYDMQKVEDLKLSLGQLLDLIWNKRDYKYEFYDSEPDDYIFNDSIISNSKGVTKFKRVGGIAHNLNVRFDISGIEKYIRFTQDLRDADKNKYLLPSGGYDAAKFLSLHHGIKGFFFVRQKRIPTVIALGLVVGLTKKDHGCIPVLKNNNMWVTKSFLSKGRMVLPTGSTIEIPANNVVENKALLVPDAELLEATFNQIFTSLEFCLYKVDSLSFLISDNSTYFEYAASKPTVDKDLIVKLTAILVDTKVKTNGTDYFSTVAGCAEEPFKTEDVKHVWNKTAPQHLTVSNTLIRGRWGYYVGMSDNSFNFGDVVSIKSKDFYTKGELLNTLEFQTRFVDSSFFSPISERYPVSIVSKEDQFSCFGGDCFPSMFTHRMMTNFIDPELPTNNKIVNPACWCENYAVRCTAEILSDTHSNLTGDSAGFYIPSPASNDSNIASLVFGILTGNIGMVILSARKMAEKPKPAELSDYANEVATAFEVYLGAAKPKEGEEEGLTPEEENDWLTNGGWSEGQSNSLVYAAEKGKIKKVNPKEMEKSASGFNLKALFKSDDKWELHGTAQINRADVNAVSFGQWISFPVRSSMNLALRDTDFYLATEEAKFNKKRSFFPLEKREITNKLLDSSVINGATKKTIHKNLLPAYKTVPFIKQEYFNRIYWSKPNVSDSFLNSFRMIYTDQYKEYNKEFGTITKIVPMDNSLLVVFTHGLGVLPIDRSIKTETEASPYLASRNVLPALVKTISKDFGSMWKNSVIQTPKGLIYGVDTVGKKIWRTLGSLVEFISDHFVTKFLNDFIDLSEFDYKAYQGHLDVKTHYNNFKNDVIFTFVKDKPIYILPEVGGDKLLELGSYILDVWGSGKLDDIVYPTSITADSFGNASFDVVFGHLTGIRIDDTYTVNSSGDIVLTGYLQKYDADGNLVPEAWTGLYKDYEEWLQIKTAEILNGKIYINDIFTGIWCDIEKWEPGTVWSLCFNEVLNKWITFYDWYPIESCNVDNIYFSFDLELIDHVYDNLPNPNNYLYDPKKDGCILNKYFIDLTFTDTCTIYDYTSPEVVNVPGFKYASYYCEKGTYDTSLPLTVLLTKSTSKEWDFMVFECSSAGDLTVSGVVTQIKFFNIPADGDGTVPDWTTYSGRQVSEKEHLLFYEIREYNALRMYLWKHGQAGLYDNLGEIRPTHWYGNLHEFNFEFVVNDTPMRQKIFNNLKIISNKTLPNKFEYEVVGEGYEWWQYKPVVHWANKKVEEGIFPTLYSAYAYILSNNTRDIRATYFDFPITDLEYRSQLTNSPYVYRKLPYIKIELTDRQGRKDRSYHLTDAWSPVKPLRNDLPRLYDYTFNTNELSIKYDKQLNEFRLHDELLGNNMWKYGRVRGNMQYLEDMWNIEIRPINFMWMYRRVREDDVLKIHLESSFVIDDFHKDVCTFHIKASDYSEVIIREEAGGKEIQSKLYVLNPEVLESVVFNKTCKESRLIVKFVPLPEVYFEVPEKLVDNMYLYHMLLSKTETRHRDKYIKVKVRYSGEDLAVILQIYTIFDESYA